MPLSGSAFFFDQVAQSYSSWYAARSPGGYALRVRRQRTLELLGTARGRILDVGCGPGVLARQLRGHGFTYWGIDSAPNMIAEGRRLFRDVEGVQLLVGEAQHLPFPNEFFDAVVCLGVLDRLASYESAIREMVRVTRPEGKLVIAFPNLLSPYAFWKKYVFYPAVAGLHGLVDRLRRRNREPSLLRQFAKLHTPGGATRLLAAAGATDAVLVFYNFNVCLAPLDEWFPNLALGLTQRLEALRTGALRYLGSGFLLRASKSARAPEWTEAEAAAKCFASSLWHADLPAAE